MAYVPCAICGLEHYRRPRDMGVLVYYCSQDCYKRRPSIRTKQCVICGTDFVARRSDSAYCGRVCANKSRIGTRYKTGEIPTKRSRLRDRNYKILADEYGDKCSWCGVGREWMGKPLTLQLDHIDGDNRNNEISNLRILCPNCHTQTPTYAGRNIGKNMEA